MFHWFAISPFLETFCSACFLKNRVAKQIKRFEKSRNVRMFRCFQETGIHRFVKNPCLVA
jgi:hypothetical protein